MAALAAIKRNLLPGGLSTLAILPMALPGWCTNPWRMNCSFEIHYHQVYTHNAQGLTAGTFDWTRYMGDRQWGFLGTRPTSDILVRLPAFTESL